MKTISILSLLALAAPALADNNNVNLQLLFPTGTVSMAFITKAPEATSYSLFRPMQHMTTFGMGLKPGDEMYFSLEIKADKAVHSTLTCRAGALKPTESPKSTRSFTLIPTQTANMAPVMAEGAFVKCAATGMPQLGKITTQQMGLLKLEQWGLENGITM